jgi:hypothetical protein
MPKQDRRPYDKPPLVSRAGAEDEKERVKGR